MAGEHVELCPRIADRHLNCDPGNRRAGRQWILALDKPPASAVDQGHPAHAKMIEMLQILRTCGPPPIVDREIAQTYQLGSGPPSSLVPIARQATSRREAPPGSTAARFFSTGAHNRLGE